MYRLNFFADEPWDEVDDDDRTRVRWFGHAFGADVLGASLRELLPGAPGGPLHMHYGVEEMFFVLAGTPTVRTPEGEERLAPGDVVYCPEGPDGLHDISNPTDEPVRLIATRGALSIFATENRGRVRHADPTRSLERPTRSPSPPWSASCTAERSTPSAQRQSGAGDGFACGER